MKTFLVIYKGISDSPQEVYVKCRDINTVYNHLQKRLPDLREIMQVQRMNYNNSIDLSEFE